MGSFRSCEIVEAGDEESTACAFRRVKEQGREHKPSILKSGPSKTLDDDINKLFESVNFGTPKSLDLSNSWRNASKKPIRAVGSYSPGIGFSEPVSLKQALRGLCISQAAEMAAIKRSSLPVSPRISETGKISSMYRSVVVETGNSDQSSAGGGQRRLEISLVPEEDTSSCMTLAPCLLHDSAPQSSHSSPNCGVKLAEHTEAKSRLTRILEGGNSSFSALPQISTQDNLSKEDEGVSVSNKFASVPCEDSVVSSAHPRKNDHDNLPKQDEIISSSNELSSVARKDTVVSSGVAEKAAPKQRRKSRLQSVSSPAIVEGRKDLNTTRGVNRGVRPVVRVRNKILVIKKTKKVAPSTDVNSKASPEVKTGDEHGSEQLVCERCQCSLRDTIKDSGKDPSSTISMAETSLTSKKYEKGDISQSSKGSACDFRSSTASISDESNLSTSNCSNKPHMSKDVKWTAISHVIKQYGSLGMSQFSLLRKLGSGDIGTVYLAELLGTSCQFAIKVMDNEFLARRKKMPRAQTEREILKMLDHPFLPTLYAQFTSDNLFCLVMEFCPGGDLHVLRQKQPGRYFPEQATRFYVAEVLLALEYLHMLGIVYRDLKPENILVREDGHIMLTDFDLSLRCSVDPILMKSSSVRFELPRVSGQCSDSNCIDPFCTAPSCKVSCFSPSLIPTTATARKLKGNGSALARSLPQLVAEPTEARSNSFVGTHEYLAPEIVKGEGHGSAVDWWTLGVFLYELLYGRTPFKGTGNEETLTNVVLQSLKFPDSPIVSFQARDLIRSLLVKEPGSRLGTGTGAAEIKCHPFFQGLNWALVRSATPPQIPESYEFGNSGIRKEKTYLEYGANGDQLEFELF